MSKKKTQNKNALPENFLERLSEFFGEQKKNEILRTFVERPTTFRINTIRTKGENIKMVLIEQGYKLKNVLWNKKAFVLLNKSKRELTDLPIYNEGKVYIQSFASMIPPLVLNPQPGDKVLDLTAAPGSKTSQMADLMERKGELVANDVNKVRFFKLKHNMELLGVTSNEKDSSWKFTLRMEDGSKLCGEYPLYFDKILLDAPCSAEARFVDGDGKTYGYWSERKIKEMAFKQRKLLFSAWYALKPGGELVYSTCTFAPEENEVQVSRLLERFPDAEMLPIESFEGIKTLPVLTEWHGKPLHKEIKKAIRISPTSEIEGFFVAKIRKKI